jgi:hypothetical protein
VFADADPKVMHKTRFRLCADGRSDIKILAGLLLRTTLDTP